MVANTDAEAEDRGRGWPRDIPDRVRGRTHTHTQAHASLSAHQTGSCTAPPLRRSYLSPAPPDNSLSSISCFPPSSLRLTFLLSLYSLLYSLHPHTLSPTLKMLYRSLTATAGLALVASTSALAQDISTAIAEVLTQFEAQDLTPNPIDRDDLELSSALTLAFGTTNLTTGQSFEFPAAMADLAEAPTFQLDVPASLAEEYAQMNFTAMIVDPGAFGQTLGGSNVTRHYLANDLRLVDGRLTNSTPAITDYAEPGPAAGTGAHRYIALVFSQDDDFTAPDGFTGQLGVETMSLDDYIENADNLGDIVAANYIYVENVSDHKEQGGGGGTCCCKARCEDQ